MMNLSSPEKGSVPPNHSHPKRIPAHLSVSLRHDPTKLTTSQAAEPEPMVTTNAKLSPNHESSDESSGNNVQKWFDRSNNHPKVAFSQRLEGSNDPPYFLPRVSSQASNDMFQARQRNLQGQDLNMGIPKQAGNDGSSVDEFRSVIDDLTIENKKLREKLRKFEQAYTPELDKHKAFEVRMHALPAHKRRELESTLNAFASSLDQSSDGSSQRNGSGRDRKEAHMNSNSKSGQKLSSSSLASNSRPVDSAYASMSSSGPTSNSNHTPGVMKKEVIQQSRQENDEDIQSFLHNIPHGLFPKHSPIMTERQKKKVVVQRLEQLFTGKIAVSVSLQSQPQQQQEVSNSAAKADRLSTNSTSSVEGVREAHMLPTEVELDSKPGKLSGHSSNDTQHSQDAMELSDDQSPADSEHEQRPTRPLDLDPDRAQIPSENIEYIRHLGQSTPQLANYDSTDVAADAQGWIYLNLLINMAQLHIINVTPDFVRMAVQDVSEQFQLSKDGNKIRWRGGSKPTQLSSSDSGSISTNPSPQDSDSWDDGRAKRRKVDSGRFASIPVNIQQLDASASKPGPKTMHYKPLFNHRNSSSEEQSSDETESRMDYESRGQSRTGGTSHPRAWSGVSRSRSRGSKRRRDGGPMVFYSGAKFCTDLCGDADIQIPLHDEDIGPDGFSNHTKDALGCASRPVVWRTDSGSVLRARPFRDQKVRSKTPDLLEGQSSDDEMSLDGASDLPETPRPFQSFDASGLGGTQPADHFVVRVETRRVKIAHESAKLSRFSTPGARLRKLYHTIPRSALEVFSQPDSQNTEDLITKHLASLTTFSSPSPGSTNEPTEQLPIQTEVISAQVIRLEPSPLPAPMAYRGSSNDSEDDFETSYSGPAPSSSANISHLRGAHTFRFGKSFTSLTDPDTRHPLGKAKLSNSSGELEEDGSLDEDIDDEDEDSEIDMLAHEREHHPESVKRKEMEFEMARIEASAALKPRSSVIAVAESEMDEEEEEEEEEEEDESEEEDSDE